MRLVTQTDILSRYYTPEETVRILGKAGFDGIDWSFFQMSNGTGPWMKDNYLDYAKTIREEAESLGMKIVQAHAPFPSSTGEKRRDEEIHRRIVRSMEVASVMGVEKIVVHPMKHLDYRRHKKETWDMNLAFYRSFIPDCERLNIKVCVENMWDFDKTRNVIVDSFCSQPDEFCAFLDAVDSPWIVGCLDFGHGPLVGVDTADLIHALGHDRMQAVHVHDVDKFHDNHTLPYMESLDWDSLTKAMGDIDFQGDFTFEADQFMGRLPKELMPDAEIFMAKVGRQLVSMVEKARVRAH